MPIHNVVIGQVPVGRLSRSQWAEHIFKTAADRKSKGCGPAVFTSANGNIIARCVTDSFLRDFMVGADGVDADGQPLVIFSRLVGQPIPERCATTDHIYDLCEFAAENSRTVYFLGAKPDVISCAAEIIANRYPKLQIVGAHHGYVMDDIDGICAKIDELAPDLLVIGMGVPIEQRFVSQAREKLKQVGAVKTAGGVFDFVSGNSPRAPRMLQVSGFEWLFRAWKQPELYLRRYVLTNPVAIYAALRYLPYTLRRKLV